MNESMLRSSALDVPQADDVSPFETPIAVLELP